MSSSAAQSRGSLLSAQRLVADAVEVGGAADEEGVVRDGDGGEGGGVELVRGEVL